MFWAFIYFFNSSIISNKLIGNESDLNDYNRIKKFIFKWQILHFIMIWGTISKIKKKIKIRNVIKKF